LKHPRLRTGGAASDCTTVARRPTEHVSQAAACSDVANVVVAHS